MIWWLLIKPLGFLRTSSCLVVIHMLYFHLISSAFINKVCVIFDHIGKKKNFEGISIDVITSLLDLAQFINEPNHLTKIFSSCIDLIFTFHPKFVVKSGIHPSLHPYCHYKRKLVKLNLKICYPLPHWCQIWYYKKTTTDCNRSLINQFSWGSRYFNRDVNKK